MSAISTLTEVSMRSFIENELYALTETINTLEEAHRDALASAEIDPDFFASAPEIAAEIAKYKSELSDLRDDLRSCPV